MCLGGECFEIGPIEYNRATWSAGKDGSGVLFASRIGLGFLLLLQYLGYEPARDDEVISLESTLATDSACSPKH